MAHQYAYGAVTAAAGGQQAAASPYAQYQQQGQQGSITHTTTREEEKGGREREREKRGRERRERERRDRLPFTKQPPVDKGINHSFSPLRPFFAHIYEALYPFLRSFERANLPSLVV
jgi:hypothetical protein